YSPNSLRTVEEPPVHIPTENPFVPPLVNTQSGLKRNAMQLDVTSYLSPRWWTRSWGWIAFLPHEPDYINPPFDPLFQTPRRPPHYDAPAIRPIYPSGFGYKKKHPHESAAMKSIHKARDWFSVWMGLLSFLIAMAETKEHELRDYPHLSKKGWADYLLEQAQATYPLDATQKDRFLSSWNIFLLSRKSLRQRIDQAETSLDKQKRLLRERRPPTKSAKVFYWTTDTTSDGYIRKQVSKKWREDTLGDYSTKQARYDSHFNEWDCSSQFGSD
ncbi:hypothetical protein HYPSUDRAFT_107106, partial [Hypholoma sublateritium FD-334 SS-4]